METLGGFVSALGTCHPPCLPPRFARPRQTRGPCHPPCPPLAALGLARSGSGGQSPPPPTWSL